MRQGKIIIISAPSGCGKSTIISQLFKRGKLNMEFSVSATNRPPRKGETDGVSYHFLTTELFHKAIAENAFVEYEEVYPGRYYGTLRSEVEKKCGQGKNVILDIDVKGGVRVKELYGDKAISLFIMPPSVDELQKRLEERGTETAESIAQRIGRANEELSYAKSYDCVVVNDDLIAAVEQTEKLLLDFIEK